MDGTHKDKIQPFSFIFLLKSIDRIWLLGYTLSFYPIFEVVIILFPAAINIHFFQLYSNLLGYLVNTTPAWKKMLRSQSPRKIDVAMPPLCIVKNHAADLTSPTCQPINSTISLCIY